jgi:cytochrome c2
LCLQSPAADHRPQATPQAPAKCSSKSAAQAVTPSIRTAKVHRNVYGAKAGSTPTFKYSSALKSSNITWTDETLNKWLTDPDSLVPDNDMEFHVPKPDERADIIRFLKAASGK